MVDDLPARQTRFPGMKRCLKLIVFRAFFVLALKQSLYFIWNGAKSARTHCGSGRFICNASFINTDSKMAWTIRTRESLTDDAVRWSGSSQLLCDSFVHKESFQSFSWNPKLGLLIDFQARQVVECVDSLAQRLGSRRLHFIFTGDSRIRQQFYSFVQTFPDYDFRWDGEPTKLRVAHYDMDVESALLGVKISYRWRPVIDQSTFEDFEDWNTPSSGGTPTLVLMGVAAHHMESRRGHKGKSFERNLILLLPHLHRLAEKSHVIWWNQFPLVDMWNPLHLSGHVQNHKMDYFNRVSRQLLNNSRILFWDSGGPLAEAYTRGCNVVRRQDSTKYFDCWDYIHTGYVAVYQSTQLLWNHLCGRLLDNCPPSD